MLPFQEVGHILRGSSSINLETISLIHKANTPQNPRRSLFFHVCHAPTFSSIPPPKGKLARGKSLSEVQLNGSCLAQADGSLRLECQCLALIPPTITRARLAFIRGLRIRGQSRIGSAGERLHVATGNSNANRFPVCQPVMVVLPEKTLRWCTLTEQSLPEVFCAVDAGY